MRRIPEILAIVLPAAIAFSADVSDLGVPGGWKASEYDKRGYELLNKHDYEHAVRYFDAAIRTDPYLWAAYYNRATTFYMQKKWSRALQDLNTTVHLKPSFFRASVTRAAVNHQLHNYQAVLRDLDVIAKLALTVRNDDEYCEMLNDRAWLRATCADPSIRNGQLAIADAKKACEIDEWQDTSYMDTLAAAYAEAGDFDSAVRYEEQAISLLKTVPEKLSKRIAKEKRKQEAWKKLKEEMTDFVNGSLIRYTKRLELYKQHRPYREAAPEH